MRPCCAALMTISPGVSMAGTVSVPFGRNGSTRPPRLKYCTPPGTTSPPRATGLGSTPPPTGQS